MKKEIMMILLAITVIIGVVVWYTNVPRPVDMREVGMFGVVVMLVVFALFIAYKRMKAVKDGLKPEDELSKKIMQKSASYAYYTSIYWLLLLMYYSDKSQLECHTLIGLGILGMAILFAGFWVYNNFWGKFNE